MCFPRMKLWVGPPAPQRHRTVSGAAIVPAHPLALFVFPLPGYGQGWWQMISLLHCHPYGAHQC